MIEITICPSCGSDKIKKVRRNLVSQFQGHTYKVPSLKFHECPDCGERIYDRQAMQKIESFSPAFPKKHIEGKLTTQKVNKMKPDKTKHEFGSGLTSHSS